jgi:hypothetical protein
MAPSHATGDPRSWGPWPGWALDRQSRTHSDSGCQGWSDSRCRCKGQARGTGPTGWANNNWTLQNQYTYLLSGQVATKALSVSNPTTKASGLLTTTYGYDPLGTLTTIQYPNSITLTYALDSLERPTGLTDSTNYTRASGVQYNRPTRSPTPPSRPAPRRGSTTPCCSSRSAPPPPVRPPA